MFGTSWGGTASLQANMDAPEPLKAVIAVCATHDRYEDDIHHMGGCLLTDTFEWGATLPAILGAPPTSNVGSDWKALWKARLEDLTFPVEAWVREEARGTYWPHGSVIHQAERLSQPVLAVGGWSDRYSNSVMSLVSGPTGPGLGPCRAVGASLSGPRPSGPGHWIPATGTRVVGPLVETRIRRARLAPVARLAAGIRSASGCD